MEKIKTKVSKAKKKAVQATGVSAQQITLGAVMLTVLAGVSLYYFYGSRKAEQHRDKTSEWFKKAREEVLQEVRRLKDTAFNKKNYFEIVRTVSQRYKDLKKFDSNDILNFITIVGEEWKNLAQKKKAGGKAKKETVESRENSNT